MHIRLAFAIAAWVLFAPHDPANASPVTSFSVEPGTIDAGQQSTLDLTLSVSNPPATCLANGGCPGAGDNGQPDAPHFDGGSVTLYSGTGLSESFTIFAGSSDSENFQFSFTYPIAGSYSPSYQFTVDYTTYQIAYYCFSADGSGSGCGTYTFVSTAIPVIDYVGQGSGSLMVDAVDNNPGAGNTPTNPGTGNTPSATPLPAALPLFATGFGVMGLLGWRRKRRSQAIVA